MTGKHAYRLVAVAAAHGGRTVLDLSRFEVAAGEVLCLIGPPGAGKSTLLLLLAGLDRPVSGEVWLGGDRLDGPAVPAGVMQRVATTAGNR